MASGQRLILLNPKVGDKILVKKTDEILIEAPKIDALGKCLETIGEFDRDKKWFSITSENERIKTAVQWTTPESDEYEMGFRIVITHFKQIKQVTWHGKGDYFATVMPDGANRSALIHQLSKRRTQIPFSKSKGLIQCVLFHPVKPCFFVAVSERIQSADRMGNFNFSKFRHKRTSEFTIWWSRNFWRNWFRTANGYPIWPYIRKATICWCRHMTKKCFGLTWIYRRNRIRQFDYIGMRYAAQHTIYVIHFLHRLVMTSQSLCHMEWCTSKWWMTQRERVILTNDSFPFCQQWSAAESFDCSVEKIANPSTAWRVRRFRCNVASDTAMGVFCRCWFNHTIVHMNCITRFFRMCQENIFFILSELKSKFSSNTKRQGKFFLFRL